VNASVVPEERFALVKLSLEGVGILGLATLAELVQAIVRR
jgi:hypothetical protein